MTQRRSQARSFIVAGVARERRVLLIEDDPDLANLYLVQLRRDGIPLEHTRTGHEGDSFVRDRLPALALVDLTLPDLDGRELIERWAVDPVSSAIPIWILSNAMPEDNLWWHSAANVQRYFLKSKVVLARLSLEIRATLGLPYGERISPGIAG
jgi:DNA-binding response OmpR family regulator